MHIHNSIKIDDILFYLDNAESIPCPFEQSWHFEKNRQASKVCQPKAFQHCSSSSTFEVSYNNRCQTNQSMSLYRIDFSFVLIKNFHFNRFKSNMFCSFYRWKYKLYCCKKY